MRTSLLLIVFVVLPPRGSLADEAVAGSQGAEPAFDGGRSFGYLKQICAIGSRTSGSLGMKAQQELVEAHFTKLGGQVTMQRFRARHPLRGNLVTMANLLCTWHPDRQRRILLCAHYDTRPLPDRDPDPRRRQTGRFIGANDGGSGVALLMELAHAMPSLDGDYGVDFLLLDGEELVYDNRRDPYFLGSEFFARNYVSTPPKHRYRWAVLLDMVADADLNIYQERYSIGWDDTRGLVESIWNTADRLGVREFIARPKHSVRDDHLRLRNVGRIPTCLIIDFDYGPRNRYWHTEADQPNKCSGKSLEKVGSVIHAWLEEVGSQGNPVIQREP